MIGGKVVDPSALVAHLRGSFAMASWLAVARNQGIVVAVPALTLAEVRAVYPKRTRNWFARSPTRGWCTSNWGHAATREVAELLAECQSGAWDGCADR